jgi:site-specific DNA-methyltransferase (adenine-specific)
VKPYYDHAGITIYHGDCREILPTLPKVDLVLTDPPYGIGLGTHSGMKEKRMIHVLKKGAYETYEDTPENLVSIVVPSISICIDLAERAAVFCAGSMIGKFPEPSCVGGVYMPSACGRNKWGFQSIAAFVLFYGTAPDLQKGAKATGLYSTASTQENGHPCPKPLSWMNWLVDLGSRESETILDPFMGSGTTLRAAKDLGRKAIGIEIEEKYCEIAVKRLAQEVLF